MQATLLAGNTAGIAMAVDIEMGFTDRLLAAPIPRFAIVAGRLAGAAAMGFLTALWFLAIGLIFGATIDEGLTGVLMIIVLSTGSAFAFGTLGAAIALRTGSASVVQGMFPLVFVILFLSTAFFPEDLLHRAGAGGRGAEPALLHRRRRPRPDDLRVLGHRHPRGLCRHRADRGGSVSWLCSLALQRRLRTGG